MLRALVLIPALPAVYVASGAYWLVMTKLLQRRLGAQRFG